MRLITPFLTLVAAAALAAEPNTLTSAERQQGWRLLFDGRTFKGWIDPGAKQPPMPGWTIEEGWIRTVKGKVAIREDLVSVPAFGDFELEFEWRIEPAGNSGVKYRIQDFLLLDESKYPKGTRFEDMMGLETKERRSSWNALTPESRGQNYVVGFEMQLIDDARNADAKSKDTHSAGALYDMIPASAKPSKPAGEVNTARVVVRGEKVEHWINGVKVLDATLEDARVKAAAERRWAPAPWLRDLLVNRPKKKGPIALQHHGDVAWFRSIKVRELKEAR